MNIPNPQAMPDNPQAIAEHLSPMNCNNPNSADAESVPKKPEVEVGERRRDEQGTSADSRGNVLPAIVIAGILGLIGMSIGVMNSAHAEPRLLASKYCMLLVEQLDTLLSLDDSSVRLADANRGRNLGWYQCMQGQSNHGEVTLRTAIRNLGIVPVARSLHMRN